MIWTAATINRFTAEGEQEIASTVKCVKERVALDVVAGTATYVLPDDCLDITRLTWKGFKIDPFSARDYHDLNDTSRSASRPEGYIFNQQGRNTIRFHPIPDIDVDTISSDLWGSEIANRVIVEYNQMGTLPDYIRRRMIKYFVLERCFRIEGDGQNLKCATKMLARYNGYIDVFKKAYHETFIAKLPQLSPSSGRRILAGPVLPSTFGESGEF